MTASAAYDLDAMEFDVVRQLLTERLVSPLGRSAVAALGPLPTAADAREALQAAAELARRLHPEQPAPLQGAIEVRSWWPAFVSGEHLIDTRDLADLKRLLRAAMSASRWLATDPRFPALCRMSVWFPPMGDLVSELEMAVDDRGEVLDTASVRLGSLRRDIEAAEMAVHASVRQFLASGDWRKVLQNTEPSWRHGRPVFQVRAEQRGRIPGVMHDRSQSGQTVFIEPDMVVEAANRLADARAAEHREIQVVLAHLGRGLRKLHPDVSRTVEAAAQVDLAVARARLIRDDGYVAPQIVDDGALRLADARHPLLLREAPADAIVPLDLTLGDPHHLLVVTGPNTGGKTVTLKTVGLLALMALSGVPIPAAEGAQVPWLESVRADIGDEQAISQNLSTFSSHVKRIASCLAHAGPRSLLLLDELGAGTDPEEGAMLGYAVLEAMLERGAYAVVTTHMGRLKEFAYQHRGAQNGSMAFDGETQQPLYRLDVGIPGASHALDIAGRVGMPEAVVARARELLGVRDDRLEEVIDRVQEARRHAEVERERTRDLSKRAAAAGAELEEKLQEAERREVWMEEEKDHVVGEFLDGVRALLDRGLSELSQAPGGHGARARRMQEEIEQLLSTTSVHRRRMRFLGSLKKDSIVFLPRWHRRAIVKKVDKVKQKVTVEYGKMRVEVPYEDVSWIIPLDGDVTS